MGHIVEVIGIGMVKFGDDSGRKKSHKTLKIPGRKAHRHGRLRLAVDAGRPVAITLRCARIDGRMFTVEQGKLWMLQPSDVLALWNPGRKPGRWRPARCFSLCVLRGPRARRRGGSGPRCGPGRRRFIFAQWPRRCELAGQLRQAGDRNRRHGPVTRPFIYTPWFKQLR